MINGNFRALTRFIRINFYLLLLEYGNKTVGKVFINVAKSNPNKVAFYFQDAVWTFKEARIVIYLLFFFYF